MTTEARYLLVMTATVVPAATAGVKRSDPLVRMEDYKAALRFWLRYEHRVAERILLLENSGADLSVLHAIAADENPLAKRVEILSVPGNLIPAGRNYGYTEMQMLDDGLLLSGLRAETTHMVKVTGRLAFPAIGKAIDMASKPFEVMVDCRKLGFPRKGADVKTQVMIFSHAFYDRVLRGAREEMNSTDVRLLEHLIFRKVIAFRGKAGVLLRFPCNVEPAGVSGFSDRSYDSIEARLTQAIRAVLRVVAKDYWF